MNAFTPPLRLASGLLAVVLAASAFAPAIAQQQVEPGWYIGGGVGYTEADATLDFAGLVGEVDLDDVCGLATFTCDTSDTGFKAFGGYRLNDNLALEVGGVVLGELSLKVSAPAVGSGRVEGEFTIAHNHSFSVAPVIHVPFGNFSAFGKFGVHRWDSDSEFKGEVRGSPSNQSESFSGVDPFYGAGGQWQFSENMDIRVEWERYQLSDSSDTIEVDGYFASLIYRF